VRGVVVNPNIIRTMIERNWVRVVGQRDVPGHPELLGTTGEFLDYFGLKSLDELPPLAQLQAMGDLNLLLGLEEAGAGAAAARPLFDSPTASDAEGGDVDDGVDGADDDELSADGGGSAELVARAPETED
jgi:segregation and condensation protein B